MDLPRYHRLRAAYYRMEGQLCTSCGATQFPPRTACRACRSGSLEPRRLSGRGRIYSHSQVATGPRGFQGPYVVALVQLDEGVLVTAQLTDIEPEDAVIGLPVEMVTRRLQDHGPNGYLVYGYKFRPLIPSRRAS